MALFLCLSHVLTNFLIGVKLKHQLITANLKLITGLKAPSSAGPKTAIQLLKTSWQYSLMQAEGSLAL
jgi:hypothetical protein